MTPKTPTGNNMAANDVAFASRMFIPKITMSEGTNTIPPPIPNRPDKMPTMIPKINNPISIICS